MTNWLWLHPGPSEPDDVWRHRFARLRAVGIEGALTLVHNGAHALYGSRQHEVSAPVLEQILPLAEAEGIAIHAWIVALRCNATKVLAEHPEWYSVSRSALSSLSDPPYIPTPSRRCCIRSAICST